MTATGTPARLLGRVRSRTRTHLPEVPPGLRDLCIVAGYLLAAFFVLGNLWADLRHHYLVDGMRDQYQWEWFFAVTAKNLGGLDNPLFSTLQNHPRGVNLMGNTVMLGISAPLAVVTATFGPTTALAIALTGGLAGTATAWYRLFVHRLGRSRVAAAVGGGFCGFAPPVIAHANGHPNFVALFVIPFIVWGVVRLRTSTRLVRDGIVLGLLVALQLFLGEEVLLLTATGLLIFVLAYAAVQPTEARAVAARMLGGLGVAALVSLAIVGYPLWWQFAGPQSYRGLFHGPAGNDLASFTAFSRQSLAGNPSTAEGLAINPTEENAFFGWPLVILLATTVAVLWRMAVARAAAITIVVAALLSLGSEITVYGGQTGIPGPWLLVSRVPLYDSVIESRLAIVCVPLIAVLLAVMTDHVRTSARDGRTARLLWTGALAAALVPIAPTPLPTVDRLPTPEFFTAGTWRDYVEDGAVVAVPLPDATDAQALQWQVDADLAFPLAEGYFIGPEGPERRGIYGAARRPTSRLFEEVTESGTVPHVTAADRRTTRADLEYWEADVVVLGPHPRRNELRATAETLLGPGEYVDGVWVWDVRDPAG